MKSKLRNAVIAVAAILVLASACWAQGKGGYTVVRLAFPGSATASTDTHDLNDQGNVVGTYRDSGGVQFGFYYQRATNTYTSLGAGVTVRGINQSNEVVGTDENLNRGLYWSSPSDLAPTELPPLVGLGHTHSRAMV